MNDYELQQSLTCVVDTMLKGELESSNRMYLYDDISGMCSETMSDISVEEQREFAVKWVQDATVCVDVMLTMRHVMS